MDLPAVPHPALTKLIQGNAAVVGPNLLVEPGVPDVFSGLNSYDPDGTIGTYRRDFNDMDGPQQGDALARSFDVPGVVRVQWTVFDTSGVRNATDRMAITVRVNHPPVGDVRAEIAADSQVVDANAGGWSDGDGDALPDAWDFYDGSAPHWHVAAPSIPARWPPSGHADRHRWQRRRPGSGSTCRNRCD